MSSSRRREDNAPSEHNASLWKSEGSLDYQPATTHTASLCVPPARPFHLSILSLLRHIPIPRPPDAVVTFSFFCFYPAPRPESRKSPPSAPPFVSDDPQVHVRKSTSLAGDTRVFETRSSEDGKDIAEISLFTDHVGTFCSPITGYFRWSIFILYEVAQAHTYTFRLL